MKKWPAGTQIEAFCIKGWTGSGPIADVYRAIDTRSDEAVTIKVLRPEFAGDDAASARFEQDGDSAETGPLCTGSWEGRPYQVWRMEDFSPGRTVVEHRPAPPSSAVRDAPGAKAWVGVALAIAAFGAVSGGVWYSAFRAPLPVVSMPSQVVHSRSISLSWTTKQLCHSWVEYWPVSGAGVHRVTPRTQNPTTAHEDAVRDLNPGTRYAYRYGFSYSPRGGAVSYSPPKLLMTAPSLRITELNVTATPDSIFLKWKTNLPATAQIEYGLTGSPNVQTVDASGCGVEHQEELKALYPDREYRFQIQAADPAELINSVKTPDQRVHTLPEIVGDPLSVLKRIAASNVQQRAGIRNSFRKVGLETWDFAENPSAVADSFREKNAVLVPAAWINLRELRGLDALALGGQFATATHWVGQLVAKHPELETERKTLSTWHILLLTNRLQAKAMLHRIVERCRALENFPLPDPPRDLPTVTRGYVTAHSDNPPSAEPQESLESLRHDRERAAGFITSWNPDYLGILNTAIRGYRRLLARGRTAEALQGLGECLLMRSDPAQNDHEQACAVFEECLRLKPGSPPLVSLARGYLLTGRTEKAIELLAKYAQSNPRNVDAHVTLGLAYDGLEEPQTLAAVGREYVLVNRVRPLNEDPVLKDIVLPIYLSSKVPRKISKLMLQYLDELEKGPMSQARMAAYQGWIGPVFMGNVRMYAFPPTFGCQMCPTASEADLPSALLLLLPLTLALYLKGRGARV